jgi:hypothetical protein
MIPYGFRRFSVTAVVRSRFAGAVVTDFEDRAWHRPSPAADCERQQYKVRLGMVLPAGIAPLRNS